jgi:hypothetical protein
MASIAHDATICFTNSDISEDAMKDLIGALILISIIVGALFMVARYTYLAWFQPDDFLQAVRHAWPEWQKNAPIFKTMWKWINSPAYIMLARVTTLTASLFCIFLLLLTAKPITLTVLHAFNK